MVRTSKARTVWVVITNCTAWEGNCTLLAEPEDFSPGLSFGVFDNVLFYYEYENGYNEMKHVLLTEFLQ